jgi:hypothetical protein
MTRATASGRHNKPPVMGRVAVRFAIFVPEHHHLPDVDSTVREAGG